LALSDGPPYTLVDCAHDVSALKRLHQIRDDAGPKALHRRDFIAQPLRVGEDWLREAAVRRERLQEHDGRRRFGDARTTVKTLSPLPHGLGCDARERVGDRPDQRDRRHRYDTAIGR